VTYLFIIEENISIISYGGLECKRTSWKKDQENFNTKQLIRATQSVANPTKGKTMLELTQ
jgi:hypothetical protein